MVREGIKGGQTVSVPEIPSAHHVVKRTNPPLTLWCLTCERQQKLPIYASSASPHPLTASNKPSSMEYVSFVTDREQKRVRHEPVAGQPREIQRHVICVLCKEKVAILHCCPHHLSTFRHQILAPNCSVVAVRLCTRRCPSFADLWNGCCADGTYPLHLLHDVSGLARASESLMQHKIKTTTNMCCNEDCVSNWRDKSTHAQEKKRQ